MHVQSKLCGTLRCNYFAPLREKKLRVKQSKKNKKSKEPLALRLVRWFFPKVEAIWPTLAHRYFIHIFFTPLNYRQPEKEKEVIKAAKKFSVTVNNKRVQCYRWGTMGPKVMLVHGWAGRAGQFRAIIPALLAKGFEVFAFDGPAHGASEGKQTNVMEFGSVMQQLIEQEGEFVAVIGHSFGGIAALYAISHGLNIRRLITISSPTLPSQVIRNFRNAINASEKVEGAIDVYLRKHYNKTFEDLTGGIHSVKNLPNPIELFLIQDENDPEVGVENAIEVKKVYPTADILITKGLGHTRILRDDTVISRCVEFVTSGPVSRL